MSQTEKIDILDRTKIMSDIEQILVLLSEQKQGRVFALDGKWGYGKTYILEQLEKKLVGLQKEGTNDDRFMCSIIIAGSMIIMRNQRLQLCQRC